MLRSKVRILVAALAASAIAISAARADDAKTTAVVLANPAISLSFSAGYLADDLGYFKPTDSRSKPFSCLVSPPSTR